MDIFFFRTTVLRKLFDITFSYKNCNFSRVIAYSLRWHRNHYMQLTIKAIKKMAGLTMLVLALLDRYSGCFLLSYSRNVRNLKTVVSIFTLIWCKNQRCMTFADCRPQTADRRPQTADRRPQTADCRPPVSYTHLTLPTNREV